MRYKILGPLHVGDESIDADLGSRKQRAVLAVLLLDANRVVSTDRLVDAVWSTSDRPPNASTVYAYVSRLRHALRSVAPSGAGEQVLAHAGGGYVLHANPGEIDALEFEQLIAAGTEARRVGRAAQAVRLLDEALALWRGDVLGDLHDEEFARVHVMRLEALRQDAEESRLESLLAADRPETVVADGPRLVARYPLRERLRGLVMLGLYRVGRQADALAMFRDGRHVLLEELGLEPGPELRHLEVAILRHDPDLQLDSSTTGHHGAKRLATVDLPRTLDYRDAFVGRETARRTLDDAWRRVPDSLTRVALVSGEPGVGKSRLVAEFGRSAFAQAATVLHGGCSEQTVIPYQPISEALRSFSFSAPSELFRDLVQAAGPALARLLPELPRRFPKLAEPLSSSPETERYLMFAATADLFAAMAARGQVVLVLDDLHWADAATWLLVMHLAKAAVRFGLFVVGTARDDELDERARSTIAELRRQGLAVVVPLVGLDVAEVDLLVGERIGARSAALVSALHGQTAGNPFYVEQLLRHLVETGGLGSGNEDDLGLHTSGMPEEVMDVITRRVRSLPTGAPELLAVAAVVGTDFSLDLLAAMSGRDADEIVLTMDRAVRAGLVKEEAAGRYAFVHPLTRAALGEELGETRRTRLHQRIGEHIADGIESTGNGDLGLAAHHLSLGRQNPAKAADFAYRASSQALDRLAHEDAAELAERGLRLLDDAELGDEGLPIRSDLLVVLAECRRRAGDAAAAHRYLLEAGAAARRLGDPWRMAQVALTNPTGMVSSSREADPARDELLEATLARLESGDHALRARALGQLAVERFYRADRNAVRNLSTDALSMARRLADPAVLEHVLLCRHVAIYDPDHLDERFRVLDELERVSTGLGHPETRLLGRLYRVGALLEAGDVVGADEAMQACEHELRHVRLPLLQFAPSYYWATRAMMSGPPEEAARVVQEAFTTLQRAGYPDARPMHNSQRYQLRWMDGRLYELEDWARAARSTATELPINQAVRAHVLVDVGRLDEASGPFERLAERDFAGIPFDNMWMTSMAICAEVAVALDDGARSAALYDALAAYAGRPVVTATAVSCLGAVDRSLGLLAARCGRRSVAEAHFDDAARINSRWRATALVELVERDRRRAATFAESPPQRERPTS